MMFTAYLILAAWFCAADLIAERIAGSPFRPIATLLLALIWPISLAFVLIAAAIIARDLKSKSL